MLAPQNMKSWNSGGPSVQGLWLSSTRDPAGSRYDMLLGAQARQEAQPRTKGRVSVPLSHTLLRG